MTQFNYSHYLWDKFWHQVCKNVQIKHIVENQGGNITTYEINQQVKKSIWTNFSDRVQFPNVNNNDVVKNQIIDQVACYTYKEE